MVGQQLSPVRTLQRVRHTTTENTVKFVQKNPKLTRKHREEGLPERGSRNDVQDFRRNSTSSNVSPTICRCTTTGTTPPWSNNWTLPCRRTATAEPPQVPCRPQHDEHSTSHVKNLVQELDQPRRSAAPAQERLSLQRLLRPERSV